MFQDKLKAFSQSVSGISGEVFHYRRTKLPPPYTVWQEEGADSMPANNSVVEQNPSGTLDYYTKQEYDPRVDEIQTVLTDAPVSWYLNSVQYEEDTGIIHYEWVWFCS